MGKSVNDLSLLLSDNEIQNKKSKNLTWPSDCFGSFSVYEEENHKLREENEWLKNQLLCYTTAKIRKLEKRKVSWKAINPMLCSLLIRKKNDKIKDTASSRSLVGSELIPRRDD